MMQDEALRLHSLGLPVSHAAIREHMAEHWPLQPPQPTEIWNALHKLKHPGTGAKVEMKGRGTPVEVDGKRYPSIRAAAKAEGITMQAARKRLASTKRANWKLAE